MVFFGLLQAVPICLCYNLITLIPYLTALGCLHISRRLLQQEAPLFLDFPNVKYGSTTVLGYSSSPQLWHWLHHSGTYLLTTYAPGRRISCAGWGSDLLELGYTYNGHPCWFHDGYFLFNSEIYGFVLAPTYYAPALYEWQDPSDSKWYGERWWVKGDDIFVGDYTPMGLDKNLRGVLTVTELAPSDKSFVWESSLKYGEYTVTNHPVTVYRYGNWSKSYIYNTFPGTFIELTDTTLNGKPVLKHLDDFYLWLHSDGFWYITPTAGVIAEDIGYWKCDTAATPNGGYTRTYTGSAPDPTPGAYNISSSDPEYVPPRVLYSGNICEVALWL